MMKQVQIPIQVVFFTKFNVHEMIAVSSFGRTISKYDNDEWT